MANINLKIAIADEALPLIDKLRDQMPREFFLRRALELGLCQIMADAANVSSDKIMHTLRGNTSDWRMVKAFLFSLDDPENGSVTLPRQTL